MKKFLVMIMLVLGISSTYAQTAYEQPKFFDNTYAGINIGANTPLSFNEFFPLNTTLNIRVGKEITPVIGFFLEGGIWLNGNTDGQYDFSANKVSNINLSLGNTINFMNLIDGYEQRKFEVLTAVSLGWAHLYGSEDHNELISKTGIDFAFNLGKEKQYQLYIEPAVNWNLTPDIYDDDIQFHKNHAYLQLAVGFNYKFKYSNETRGFKTYDISAMNAEINALRKEANKQPVIQTVIVTDTVEIEKIISKQNNTTVVYFAEGKTNLTESTINTLNTIVDGNAQFTVKGYASETGSDEANERISEERAANVANYLKQQGCNVVSVLNYSNTSDPVARVAIITSYTK